MDPSVSVDARHISTAAAHAAVAAAVEHARSLGVAVNVAVVDAGGAQMAFLRMNGAFLHSIDIALDKAYTAASFGFPTSGWAGAVGDDELLRIGLNQRARLVMFGGGLPIVEGGHRIGGIGVSGGSAAQDEVCAAAGIRALGLTPA
ncbi:MAG TPA: heme-binding protein [Burkholderiaceae bacterium]|nr:heme-binding protein [Burkholderiaceae bacterium]HRH87404.1 heme-binding protein [Rubrivivax sp.]